MSKYTIVSVGDAARGERTNIGIIVFGPDGKQYGRRLANLNRARRRGDWPAETWMDEAEIDRWAADFDSEETYHRRIDTFGHCMSQIQVGPLCGSLCQPDELLADTYPRFVTEE